MRKRRKELQTYEMVPATARLPMLPRLGRDDLNAGPLGELRPGEWFSRVTTIAEADSNRHQAVETCLNAYALGDTSVLGELLELDKGFGHDPKLADAMADMIIAARLGKKRIGRPRGTAGVEFARALRITRIVEGFREGKVRLEEVFAAMEEQNFEYVTDRTRRNDYSRARRHPAMQPQLFPREDQRRFIRRRAVDDSGYVFVPQRVRIELPCALPPGTQLGVRVTRSGNTVTFACEIRQPAIT